MQRWHGTSAALIVSLAISLLGCDASTSAPATAPVMVAGLSPENACERAVVTRAEYLRDHGVVGSESLESDVFRTCSYPEFRAANAKMAERYRYPGDGRTYVGRNCVRLFALYRGSRLCRTR